ncbi:MAG: hypothetical protein IJG46_03625 [Prevotella sp.]|nr:hypothetical protein [Prevotella sp.]
MASINEILASEAKTNHSVRLFREGSLFFRAYERSAYLFVHHVRMYEIHHKYFKVCNNDVVWLGFPQKSLPSLGCQYVENADGTVSIPVEVEIDEQQFLQWKSEQISHQKLPVMDVPFTTKTDKDEAEVLQRLRTFNLAGSTPMETMLFVSELQRMLNKGKGTSV